MATPKLSSTGTVLLFKPRAAGKRKRGTRARYFYPREALEQPYFTVTGRGDKYPARLGLSMLSCERFESQIALLLAQLANEGYDVSGPEAEFRAMREVIVGVNDRLEVLGDYFRGWSTRVDFSGLVIRGGTEGRRSTVTPRLVSGGSPGANDSQP